MSSLRERIKGLFRLSDLPAEAKRLMEEEGLLFIAEGVRITVAYHRFKAPGKYFRNKRETGWGSFAVSQKRIVGYVFRKRAIHIPIDRDEIRAVKFSCIDRKVLVMDFDPSVSDSRWSGRLEIRYHTERAPEAYGIIRDLIGQ